MILYKILKRYSYVLSNPSKIHSHYFSGQHMRVLRFVVTLLIIVMSASDKLCCQCPFQNYGLSEKVLVYLHHVQAELKKMGLGIKVLDKTSSSSCMIDPVHHQTGNAVDVTLMTLKITLLYVCLQILEIAVTNLYATTTKPLLNRYSIVNFYKRLWRSINLKDLKLHGGILKLKKLGL